jgi:Amt family ammonium transporter
MPSRDGHALPSLRDSQLSARRVLALGAGGLALLGTSVAASAAQTNVAASAISAGDTAWMLTSTALVLMMTLPGLAFFYGGLVRKKNILGTMTQVFIVAAIVSVLWFGLGYTLAFASGSPVVGFFDTSLSLPFMPQGDRIPVHALAQSIPAPAFALFEGAFAIITAALIVGAFAERVKFGVAAVFCGLWSVLVYAPVAHWVWHPEGWLYAMGVRDFAGGLVVHVNAGAAALACALVVGPRHGYGREPMIPSNLAYMLIGAGLLWIGWFGFNGGSALAANGAASLAMVNTQIAASLAAVIFVLCEWMMKGQASLVGMSTGAVAGLVAITPAAGYVSVDAAYLFGVLGGVVAFASLLWLKPLLNIDDSLDVFAIHGTVGIAGSLLTPFLTHSELAGAKGQPMAEAIGVLAVLGYSFVVSWLLMKLLDVVMRAKVTRGEELDGLDLSQHGERVE